MAEKLTCTRVLGLIGGIFLLIGILPHLVAVGRVALARYLYGGGIVSSWPYSTLRYLVALELICALLTLIGGAMVYVRPQTNTIWGFTTLISAIIGFGPGNFFGGFVIGSILGIVAGANGIAFKPRVASIT